MTKIMELIKQNPILSRTIIIIVALLIVYGISGFIIKSLKLKITKTQLLIFVIGVYLLIDFIIAWL